MFIDKMMKGHNLMQVFVHNDRVLELMLMKYHIIQAMLYNHNYSDFESEKQRFIKTVTS